MIVRDVTCWRLLGEVVLTSPVPPVPEVLRPFVGHRGRFVEDVILLDPEIPAGSNWLAVFEASDGDHGPYVSRISDTRPEVLRIYVPAPEGTGFSTESPLFEAHWRSSAEESSELPWPKPEPGWHARATFLAQLDRIEQAAYRVLYRGISPCRLCGQPNGHVAFRLARWEWPAGFRHYITEHDVRPSAEFEAFVRANR